MSARRPSEVALASVIGLLLLAAAWRVLSLGLADHGARSQPDAALRWQPNHSVALIEAAEQLATQGGDPARSGALARAALRANPLEGRAYRVLGQLAESNGDEQAAVRLYEIATMRSPRDLATHVWLEGHYLSTGRVMQALQHIDLFLRIVPKHYQQQQAVMWALASLPQAHLALADMLGTHPPWRQDFMARICGVAGNSAASIAPLMTRLRLAPGGLEERELSPWIECLNRDRRWGEAYLTWVAALPADRQKELANLFNGGFEREPSGMGFDWRFTQVPGAFIERLPTAGAGGKVALRVSFEDRRVSFQHVRQMLALPPGRYRLDGRARAEGLRSERGLVWSVTCADDGKPVASTDPLAGVSPWRPFSVSFELPPGSCGGQWLQLSVPARIAAEQRIGGRAWFDDMRIIREQ